MLIAGSAGVVLPVVTMPLLASSSPLVVRTRRIADPGDLVALLPAVPNTP